MALDQMPRRLSRGGTTWELGYRPILVEGRVEKILVVISDLTLEIAQERSELERRELTVVLERAMRDADGVAEFMKECDALAARIGDAQCTASELLRAVHTLKGNCAIFGVAAVSTVCHEVEGAAHEAGGPIPAEARALILQAWASFRARMDPFMQSRTTRLITLTAKDHKTFLRSVVRGAPQEELVRSITDWAREPADLRFSRLADQVVATARRLGKAAPEVVVDGGGLRLPREKWSSFWGAFVHAVRNALDHGLESTEERALAGKREHGRIDLRARLDGDFVEISLADDGRGVDWERVRAKARGVGLPAETPDDLAEALFFDGLSTRDDATELSGRGVGMGALRSICLKLGGSISVESEVGRGTTVRVRLPRDEQNLLESVVPDTSLAAA
jgi:two-component system chemotaxis sensor kinase CheA